MIAMDAGKVMSPSLSPVSVMIPMAPPDWITIARIEPSRPNHHRLMSLYCEISNPDVVMLCDIHSIATNRRLNQIIALAICSLFSDLRIISATPPIAISGNTMCPKSYPPNPKKETISGSEVAPIFDQKMMPRLLLKGMRPALNIAIVSSVTRSPLPPMSIVVTSPTGTANRIEEV